VLRTSAASVSLDDLANMSPDDHRKAFLAFIAGLIGDFDRYLERDHIDLLRDGVSYRLVGLWLTDEERAELSRDLVAVLQRRIANAPGAGRKQRILATVFLPGSDSAPPDRSGGVNPT